MKIALFGAGGRIGQCILQEALSRGHQVTAVVRDPDKFQTSGGQVRVLKGDAQDSQSVAKAAAGQDVLISAVGPGQNDDPELLVKSARGLIQGVKAAGEPRLVIVGGAGSLEVAPGQKLLDSPGFPAAWRPVALAHLAALDTYRASDINWTFVSPADRIEPGKRTGIYRTGGDQLIRDEKGDSRISMEDFAAAVLDEVENARSLRKRMTVAY